jgi:hypothetical protein
MSSECHSHKIQNKETRIKCVSTYYQCMHGSENLKIQ